MGGDEFADGVARVECFISYSVLQRPGRQPQIGYRQSISRFLARSRPRRPTMTTAEHFRLEAVVKQSTSWKLWGSYLSERQRGGLREDQSDGVATWNSFVRDQARSCSRRWVEDGLAVIPDREWRLCFALVPWNGKAPIFKERHGSSGRTRDGAIPPCSRTISAAAGSASWLAMRPAGLTSPPGRRTPSRPSGRNEPRAAGSDRTLMQPRQRRGGGLPRRTTWWRAYL